MPFLMPITCMKTQLHPRHLCPAARDKSMPLRLALPLAEEFLLAGKFQRFVGSSPVH